MKCTDDAWYIRINECNEIAWLFGAMPIKGDNSGCFNIIRINSDISVPMLAFNDKPGIQYQAWYSVQC